MIVMYKAGGRDIKTGVDCYGWVKHRYQEEHGIDIVDFDYVDPNDRENEKYFVESMNSPRWKEVKAQKGAVVALRVNGYISHCGFMESDKEFTHIMESSGVARAKVSNPKWRSRVVGYYKYD